MKTPQALLPPSGPRCSVSPPLLSPGPGQSSEPMASRSPLSSASAASHSLLCLSPQSRAHMKTRGPDCLGSHLGLCPFLPSLLPPCSFLRSRLGITRVPPLWRCQENKCTPGSGWDRAWEGHPRMLLLLHCRCPTLLTPACVLFLNTPSTFLPQGLCTTVILSRILLPDIHLVHIRSLLTSCQKGLL